MMAMLPLICTALLVACVLYGSLRLEKGVFNSRVRGFRKSEQPVFLQAVVGQVVNRVSTATDTWLARRKSAIAAAMLVLILVLQKQGPVVALLLVGALLMLAISTFRFRRARVRRQIENELLDLVEHLAHRLQSGLSLATLIVNVSEECGPRISEHFEQISQQVRHGMPIETALRKWERQMDIPQVSQFVSVVSLALVAGGNVSDSLLHLAGSLRRRSRLRAEMLALTSQARMSAYVLSVLPLAFGLSSSIFSGRAREFLFHSALGSAVLLVGITLDGLGAWWLSKIARVEI